MRYLPVLLLFFILASCKNATETGKENPEMSADTAATGAGNVPEQEESLQPPSLEQDNVLYKFPDIEGMHWALSKYEFEGQTERPVGDNPIYIQIEGNELIGNGGCNDINGQAELREDGTVSFSSISKTKKICAGVMTQETRIIQLLEGAKTYKVNLVFLELTGPEGQLTFRNDKK